MDNVLEEKKKKKSIKAKVIIITTIIIIAIALICTSIALYTNNDDFRNWVDKYILKKEITEADTISIDLRRK